MNDLKLDANPMEALGVKIIENGTDFSKLCRTCLRETNDNDLGNETLCVIIAGKLVRVYEMFEAVTGVKIKSNDELPHHVCITCLTIVNSSYSFRAQSQRADEILRGIINGKPKDPIELNQSNEVIKNEVKSFTDTESDSDEAEQIFSAEDYEDVFIYDEIKAEQTSIISDPTENSNSSEHGENNTLSKKGNKNAVQYSGKRISCIFCKQVFKRQCDIVQHYKNEHPKGKPYKCKDCSACYKHITSMVRHKRMHRPGASPRLCPVCSELNCIAHKGKRGKYKK